MSLKVCVIAAVKYEKHPPDHKGLIQGLKDLKCKALFCDPILDSADQITFAIKKFKPDIVIHHMSTCLEKKLPEVIGREVPQVFWMLDYRPYDWIRGEGEKYWDCWKSQSYYLKHILLSNKEQIPLWEEEFQLPVSFLPHGCYVVDELIYDERFHYPCVFIGQMSDSRMLATRKNFIRELMRRTRIVHLNAPSGSKERNEIWKNMPKIYYSSDVVLDICHFWDVPGYACGRFFYSSGLGGATVSKRFPECETLYPDGIKLYFDTLEQAVEKIKWLQENPKLRERIKRKAYKYSKTYHSYKVRYTEIFERVL